MRAQPRVIGPRTLMIAALVAAAAASMGCAGGFLSAGALVGNDAVLPWNKKHAREAQFAERLVQAKTFERNGQGDKAWAEYHLLAMEFPDRAEPLHRLGVLADRRRRHKEAHGYYEKALKLEPDNAVILNDLGYSYYLDGDLENAQRAILNALEKAPHNARFHNNLGLVYGQMGNLEKAFEEFGKAGGTADAHHNMAYILAGRGDIAGAKRAFLMALQVDPRHEKARRALAVIEKVEQDPDGLNDLAEFYQDGIRYVPFDERSIASPAAHPSVEGGRVPTRSASSLGARNPAQRLDDRLNAVQGRVVGG